jgi:hypothetical protein
LVGAVLESLEQQKGGASRVTRSQATKRVKHNPSVIEVKTEEEDLEDLEDNDSSDLSDYIVIVYDN